MTRQHGWTSPFRERPWGKIHAFLGEIKDPRNEFQHMLNIIESIARSPAADQLAGQTSMHDLLVTTKPISRPPLDVIAVRAPSSLRHADPGFVVIEHLSTTGHDDKIQRPVAEAVPLFWRFVIEKYGIEPQR